MQNSWHCCCPRLLVPRISLPAPWNIPHSNVQSKRGFWPYVLQDICVVELREPSGWMMIPLAEGQPSGCLKAFFVQVSHVNKCSQNVQGYHVHLRIGHPCLQLVAGNFVDWCMNCTAVLSADVQNGSAPSSGTATCTAARKCSKGH